MLVTLTILFVISTQTLSQKQLCSNESSVVLTDRMHNGVTYREGEYFVDNQTGIERGCLCMKVKCARKCCLLGQVYNVTMKNCQNSSIVFNPPVWTDYSQVDGFNASNEFHLIQQRMICDKSMRENRLKVYPAVDTYRLRTDGSLFVDVQSDFNTPLTIYNTDKYCIDTFVDDRYIQEDRINALVCFPEEDIPNHYALSSSCMLISCFFILLTVGVYAWLPELRNLHGMVLIAYLLSFFVGFLFMASLQILILINEISATYCRVASFIVYFSILAAFFWLNVMCYDIWWTFSGKRGQPITGNVRSRFLGYCAYALGAPTLLTALLAGLEFADLPYHPLLPLLRRNGCFLYGKSRLLYLYGPITVLCIMNLIFFVLTAVNIAKIKKQTKQVLSSMESSRNDQQKKDTQRFSLYIKLFAVMGFSWILEVISSLYPKADNFWQITDAYNVLIGLIIFIIFVCKKKTLNLLMNRYRVMRGLPITRKQPTISTNMSSQSRDSMHMNTIKPSEVDEKNQ